MTVVAGVFKNGSGISKEVNLAVDIDGRLLGSGGGGAGSATSPSDIAAGIDASLDINVVVTALTASIRVSASPTAQTLVSIAAGAMASYLIPVNCRCLTICINSGNLVYFTEDGATPTNTSCWFAGGSKEIWETNVPQGSTLKFLAISATTISIQARV